MMHKHECPECGQVWEHEDDRECGGQFSSLWPEYAKCGDCDGPGYSGASLRAIADAAGEP